MSFFLKIQILKMCLNAGGSKQIQLNSYQQNKVTYSLRYGHFGFWKKMCFAKFPLVGLF